MKKIEVNDNNFDILEGQTSRDSFGTTYEIEKVVKFSDDFIVIEILEYSGKFFYSKNVLSFKGSSKSFISYKLKKFNFDLKFTKLNLIDDLEKFQTFLELKQFSYLYATDIEGFCFRNIKGELFTKEQVEEVMDVKFIILEDVK